MRTLEAATFGPSTVGCTTEGFFSLAVLDCGLRNVLGTSSLLWETFV